MPSNSPVAIVIIGGIALFLGLIGGRIETSQIKFPTLLMWQRILLSLIGVFLILLGGGMDPSTRNLLPWFAGNNAPTLTSVNTHRLSPEEALSHYFLLLKDAFNSSGDDKTGKLHTAYGMLSEEFKERNNNSSFDDYQSGWEEIGNIAILLLAPYTKYLDDNTVVVTIHLRFGNDSPSCTKIPFIMEKNENLGNQEFDYWLIKGSDGGPSRC